jgi:RNA polymerase-binding transcription factor DksA
MATKKKTVDAKKSTAKKASRSAKTNTKKAAKQKAATPKSGAKKVALKKKTADKKTAPAKKATSIRAKDQKSMTKKATVKKTTTVKKAAPATGQKAASSKKAKPAATKKAAAVKTEKPKAKVTAPKKDNKQPQAAQNHKPEKKEVTVQAPKTTSSRSTSTKPPRFVYKPEPSILDIPKENSGPRRRYSDNELQEFKDLIQHKLEAARKELVYLQGLITRKDEAGTDDTENKYMGVEDGGGTMEREQLSQLASRQIQYIDHLEKALVRIENKTYGICRETGRLIDKARLRAVPHATLSIEAKLAKKK